MNDDHYFIGTLNDVLVCSDSLIALDVKVGQSIKVHSARVKFQDVRLTRSSRVNVRDDVKG